MTLDNQNGAVPRGMHRSGRVLAAVAIAALMMRAAPALADQPTPASPTADIRSVGPALAKFAQDRVIGELWKRPSITL